MNQDQLNNQMIPIDQMNALMQQQALKQLPNQPVAQYLTHSNMPMPVPQKIQQSFQGQLSITSGFTQNISLDKSKKIFIKNIPTDIPNEFLEILFRFCGNVMNLRRTKNYSGEGMATFCYLEYEFEESILKSMRLLHNYYLLTSRIQITYAEKTEKQIKQWEEEERKRFYKRKDQGQMKEYNNWTQYLERHDRDLKAKIENYIYTLGDQVHKYKVTKQREEERKMTPKERRRIEMVNQHKQDYEKKAKQKLLQWQMREKRQKNEREIQNQKEKQKASKNKKLMKKLFSFDNEEEKLYLKQYKENKKRREQEYLDDMKWKESLQIKEETKEIKVKSKVNFQVNEDNTEKNQQATIQTDIIFQQKSPQETKKKANTFDFNEEEEEPKMIANVPLPFDKSEMDMELEEEPAPKLQQETLIEDKPPTKTDEEIRQILKVIITKIQKMTKKDIYNTQIEWHLIAKNNIFENKLKPWLLKQSVIYIGQEETEFVNMILKKLINKEKPEQIKKQIEQLLEEDSEEFTIKLWKQIILEVQKFQNGLL